MFEQQTKNQDTDWQTLCQMLKKGKDSVGMKLSIPRTLLLPRKSRSGHVDRFVVTYEFCWSESESADSSQTTQAFNADLPANECVWDDVTFSFYRFEE
jgi:hypothetical protein